MRSTPKDPGYAGGRGNLTHEQARALMDKLLESPLNEPERQGLNGHLAECPACAAYLSGLNTLDRHLAAALPGRFPELYYPPAQLEQRRRAIHDRLRGQNHLRSFVALGGLAGAAVMLLVLVMGLGWVVFGTLRQPALGGKPPQVAQPAAQATPTGRAISFGEATIDPASIPTEAGGDRQATQPARAAGNPEPTPTPITGEQPVPAENPQPKSPTAATAPNATTVASAATPPTATPAAGFGAAMDRNPARIAAAQAETLIREWIFREIPQMNPETRFPVVEITPDEAWQQMGGQVFKVSGEVMQNEAFFLRGSQVTWLGTAFGGMGVQTMLVTDLDASGAPELLFTRAFGSGRALDALGLVLIQGDTTRVLAEEALVFEGSLRLERQTGQVVLAYLTPMNGGTETALGRVTLADGRLGLLPPDPNAASYHNQRFGVSFAYPRSWRPDGEDAYQGQDGYFRLELLPFSTPDIRRACELEVNRQESLYGEKPQLSLGPEPNARRCLIQPGEGSAGQAAIVFLTTSGQPAILRGSRAHFAMFWGSLALRETSPASPPINMTTAAPTTAKVVTRTIADLQWSELAVVSAEVDTPSHFEYSSRIPSGVFPARLLDARVKGLTYANRLLEPFGARLEKTGGTFTLHRSGQEPVGGFESFYTPAVWRSENGAGDFALLVEKGGKGWLARSGSLAPYDLMAHHYTAPVFAGERLISVESKGDWGEIAILQDGQPLMTYRAFFLASDPVHALTAWNGQWVLEVNGVLIVDGAILNLKAGYSEAFNARTLNGRSFFFFEQNGEVQVSYNGHALPIRYDQIIHDRCCEPAAFNVTNAPDALYFHARRDDTWYLVEIK